MLILIFFRIKVPVPVTDKVTGSRFFGFGSSPYNLYYTRRRTYLIVFDNNLAVSTTEKSIEYVHHKSAKCSHN